MSFIRSIMPSAIDQFVSVSHSVM